MSPRARGGPVLLLVAAVACSTGVAFDDTNLPTAGRIIFRSQDPHAIFGVAALNAINPDGTGLVTLVASLPSGTGSALSPDGTKLALAAPGSGINWLDLGTLALHSVATSEVVGAVNWTSDSKQIFFDDYNQSKIGRVNTDGSGVQIVVNGLYPSSAGRLLTYQLDGRAWLADVNGSGLSQLDTVPGASDGGPPQLSPDGQHVAMSHSYFTSFTDLAEGQLFVYDIGTRALRQLTPYPSGTGAPPIGAPTWSPDGQRIAYGSNGKLFAIGSDGTGRVQLTPDSLVVSKAAAWSPHGTSLAFISNDDVYIVNADGSGLRNLTHSRAIEFGVSWAPR